MGIPTPADIVVLNNCNEKQPAMYKQNVVKKYYEFFNYKDDASWQTAELKEKFYYRAEQCDISSVRGSLPDGYLSKSEYEEFLAVLRHENEKVCFPNINVSQEEKEIVNEFKVLGGIIQNSDKITDKEKKSLKFISNVNDLSLATAIGGLSLGCLGKIAGIAKLAGLGFFTGITGVALTLIATLGWNFYQKYLEAKVC